MYSNCCCSCSFEPEIIKIGQSSHKMYSNNILNFQESTTILDACTKKSGNIEFTTYIYIYIYIYVVNSMFPDFFVQAYIYIYIYIYKRCRKTIFFFYQPRIHSWEYFQRPICLLKVSFNDCSFFWKFLCPIFYVMYILMGITEIK